MKKKILLIGILFLLLTLVLPTIKADDIFQPSDYYDKFWNFFNKHITYSLEGRTNDNWIQDNSYLTINKTKILDNTSIKLNFIITVPKTMDVRLTFGIDKDIANLDIERIDEYCYFMNYSNDKYNYTVYFNWSDLKDYSDLTFTHGIKNNKFYWRMQKNNVPKGIYGFDPTFGSPYSGGRTGGGITFVNIIRARAGLLREDGIAISLAWYGRINTGFEFWWYKYKLCLYEYIDFGDGGVLIAETGEHYNSGTGLHSITGWHTEDLLEPVYLKGDTWYYIAVVGDIGGDMAGIDISFEFRNHPINAKRSFDLLYSYNGFPDPIIGETETVRRYIVYCEYEQFQTETFNPLYLLFIGGMCFNIYIGCKEEKE